jgi:inorganic pyrophosphatase
MIKVCIEVEGGSRERHRFDERSLKLVGVEQVTSAYPYPYGFIPGTRTMDGGGVDCYLITHERVKAGEVVECEPIGLLEQSEDQETDHKVLAALPGREVDTGAKLLEELRDFIYAVFASHPDANIRVGRILPREAAEEYIRACHEPDN